MNSVILQEKPLVCEVITLKLGIANSFIIKQKGIILVDTGINVETETFIKLFAEKGIDPREISLIIITHGHTDHFAHINTLKKLTGARILCHKNAVQAIETGKGSEVVARTLLGQILKQVLKGKVKGGYIPETPDIIIEKPYDLSEFGISGKIIPTPGHTDCSVSIVLDTNQAIIGDMMVSSPPFPQTPLLAVFAYDTKLLLNSIQALLDANVDIFYASHGGPYTREQVIKLVETFTKKRR